MRFAPSRPDPITLQLEFEDGSVSLLDGLSYYCMDIEEPSPRYTLMAADIILEEDTRP